MAGRALPTADQLQALRREMAALRTVPDETIGLLRAAAGAPPVDALRMVCATLSLDLPDPDGISP